jgi:hypothetical protein
VNHAIKQKDSLHSQAANALVFGCDAMLMLRRVAKVTRGP